MAIATQSPDIQLSEEEAEQYAKAIAAVARHYDLGASAKALDWTNLLTTMGSIYGVRAMAAVARRKERQRQGPLGPIVSGAEPPPAPPAANGQAPGEAIDFSMMTGRPN